MNVLYYSLFNRKTKIGYIIRNLYLETSLNEKLKN